MSASQIQTFYEGEFSYAEKIAALKHEAHLLEVEEVAVLHAKAAAIAESYAKEVAALSAKAAEAAEEFAKMISVLVAKMTPVLVAKTEKKGYRPRAELSPEELAVVRQRDSADKKRLRAAKKAAKASASASPSASAPPSASASPPKPKRVLSPEHLAKMKAGREASAAAKAAPIVAE